MQGSRPVGLCDLDVRLLIEQRADGGTVLVLYGMDEAKIGLGMGQRGKQQKGRHPPD
jgi:hypothetical protein